MSWAVGDELIRAFSQTRPIICNHRTVVDVWRCESGALHLGQLAYPIGLTHLVHSVMEVEISGYVSVEEGSAIMVGSPRQGPVQGRHEEGDEWLKALSSNWGAANQLRHHLWWHLCLFLLESGEFERICTLLTTELRNPDSPLVRAAPAATMDIQNVASLLLRLELRGVDVEEHWCVLADICAQRVNNHTNAFGNLHDMIVLAATGQFEKAEELLRNLYAFIESGHGSLFTTYRVAGIAACQAMLAHRKKEYSKNLC